jgi:hypothetical protein
MPTEFSCLKPAADASGKSRIAIRAAESLLLLLSVAYLLKGTYYLTLSPYKDAACDLNMRWTEQQYVLRGQNPYDAYTRIFGDELWTPETADARRARVAADCGIPNTTLGPNYPPWSYATGIVLMWPADWASVRLLYCLFNLAAWCFIGWAAYRVGESAQRGMGLLFSAATLAASSICSALGNGNYGVIILAALIAALWFDEKRRPLLAGLMLGIALSKPTIALPFLLPFLVKRRWGTLCVAIVYICAGGCLTWFMTGTDPLTMFRQMIEYSKYWGVTTGADIVFVLAQLGVERELALKVAAVSIGGLGLAVLFAWRRSSMLTLFAITAVVARFWTYHRAYDNMMLVFLFWALGLVALRRRDILPWIAAAVLGISLWLPWSAIDNRVMEMLLLISWIGCGVVFLILAPRTKTCPTIR